MENLENFLKICEKYDIIIKNIQLVLTNEVWKNGSTLFI